MAEEQSGYTPFEVVREQGFREKMAPVLRFMREVIGSMGPHIPFQSSLNNILNLLCRDMGFIRPHLVLFDSETGVLRLSSPSSYPTDPDAQYGPGEGVTGQVFSTGKAVVLKRISDEPAFASRIFKRSPEECAELSFICVPVMVPNSDESAMSAREIIGTLNSDAPFISDDNLELRCIFLEVVAALIANEYSYLQEERAKQSLLSSPAPAQLDVSEKTKFTAQSKIMQHVLHQASHLAQSRSTVLIAGEPGVGKERLANRIHQLSQRREMPIFTCHFAAVKEDRHEVELRGYVKGAFPSAMQTHKGLIEQAERGTLFLQSVEYMSADAQQAVLELLRNSQVTRLGADTPLPVDVRVIAASNADLDAEVARGSFSEELLTRLRACMLTIPPLRERREDIIPLAEDILRRQAIQDGSQVIRITYPALELLNSYYWPGNVPELRNCLMQAAEASQDHVIRAGDLPPSLQTAESSATEADLPLGEAVAAFEKELLVEALIKSGGNMIKAAKLLKTSYRIVNYKVKKYNIDPHRFSYRK